MRRRQKGLRASSMISGVFCKLISTIVLTYLDLEQFSVAKFGYKVPVIQNNIVERVKIRDIVIENVNKILTVCFNLKVCDAYV